MYSTQQSLFIFSGLFKIIIFLLSNSCITIPPKTEINELLYKGTRKYNCMILNLELLDEGKSRAKTISAKLEDQECAAGWVDCGLCQVKRKF